MGPSWVMKQDGASVQNVVLNMDSYVENYNNNQHRKLFGQLFGNRMFRTVWGSANSLSQFSEVSSFLVLIGYSSYFWYSVFAWFKATFETNEVWLLVWSHHLACPVQRCLMTNKGDLCQSSSLAKENIFAWFTAESHKSFSIQLFNIESLTEKGYFTHISPLLKQDMDPYLPW